MCIAHACSFSTMAPCCQPVASKNRIPCLLLLCWQKTSSLCLLMNVIGACCNPHNTQVARHDILDEAGEEEKIVPGEDESEYELDKDVADHREL